jgi:predicted permease
MANSAILVETGAVFVGIAAGSGLAGWLLVGLLTKNTAAKVGGAVVGATVGTLGFTAYSINKGA